MHNKYFVLFLNFVINYNACFSCRDRGGTVRQDGGICFEIPPWQHQPVELESHLKRVDAKWGPYKGTKISRKQTSKLLGNREIARYMDTVIAPFLDTYHRNIQNSYQQMTTKILSKIKEEINAAVKKKQVIYKDLTKLADELQVPLLCAEERRNSRTVATSYISQIHACTEISKNSITKMGKYAEEMIAITRNHMKDHVQKSMTKYNMGSNGTVNKTAVEKCLRSLCKVAVSLGYELDLSLTNARRHNEQSFDLLTSCTNKAKKQNEDTIAELKGSLYQCVYA